MESCIYEGRVRHRRRQPVSHAFEFPLFMMYLDLDELDEVFRGRWLWSTRRPAPLRFHRGDHLGDPSVDLGEAVRDRVEARAGVRPRGPIRLLTQLRHFGYVFNPLSLYYCLGARGRGLEAVVAHVSNTPWNERHSYVLIPGTGDAGGPPHRIRVDKEFHVSPFMDMDMAYHWTLSEPGPRLDLRIENRQRDGTRLFDAALDLERREISATSLARVLAIHPLMTFRIVAGIYRQAFRLRRKGVPVHPHPGRAQVRSFRPDAPPSSPPWTSSLAGSAADPPRPPGR